MIVIKLHSVSDTSYTVCGREISIVCLLGLKFFLPSQIVKQNPSALSVNCIILRRSCSLWSWLAMNNVKTYIRLMGAKSLCKWDSGWRLSRLRKGRPVIKLSIHCRIFSETPLGWPIDSMKWSTKKECATQQFNVASLVSQ